MAKHASILTKELEIQKPIVGDQAATDHQKVGMLTLKIRLMKMNYNGHILVVPL